MDTTAQVAALPHVVIIGAGFGGLQAAKAFRKKRVRVTIIDRTNHHLFQPLLYQVATAGLSPAEIAAPVRAILRGQKNATVLMGMVTKIDMGARQVILDHGHRKVTYDYLILAAGGSTSYFGHDDWAAVATGLKTLDEATLIREKVLMAFEMAEKEVDPQLREALMTVVVVGGGPTGVEMAGAMAELARFTLIKDFRNIHPESAKVILIEAGDRLLGVYTEDLTSYTEEKLRKMGVYVRVNTRVTNIDAGVVETSGGVIHAANTIWAAGVAGNPLAKDLGVPTDRGSRVIVDADLRLPGQERVYAIGDFAHYEHPHTYGGKMIPGLSPPAIQQGDHAVKNILLQMAGKPTEKFQYSDLGSMATIGRSAAVADVHGFHMKGFIAWMAWLFIHLIKLVSFQSRVVVLMRWAYSYFTWSRGSRLIMRSPAEVVADTRLAADVELGIEPPEAPVPFESLREVVKEDEGVAWPGPPWSSTS
ncbi:MAG: NAD(P)/FAD-dependent oxidoreductase [Armatimonadetes bacterium]|nr:NAD(P)/FAD-dependent oxidoreductase [Armatimonadota bacterium]